jgi:hypothetical protein
MKITTDDIKLAQEAAAEVRAMISLILMQKPASSFMKVKIPSDAVSHGVHK